MQSPRVVLITDFARVSERELLSRIEAARPFAPELRARLAVQLREPELGARDKLAVGARLREATRAIGASLLVNDRLDLSDALEADGVHLRRGSVNIADAREIVGNAFVSIACHTEAEVMRAADEGADAAILAPIFATPGKGAPLGLTAITKTRAALLARGHAAFALIALGGIGPLEARAAFAHGASGVASIRGDLGSTLAECLAT